MPYRKTVFVNNHFYHLLNRGNNQKLIFKTNSDYQRAIATIDFYRFFKPPLRFSDFNILTLKEKEITWQRIKQKPVLVEIISFCLMPNHLHLLVKQTSNKGVSIFMSNWQNSYARYFNLKYKQKGYLFESAFKAKIISKEELLWHVARYIHLNPSSSSLVPINNLANYPWSSLPEYLGLKKPIFTNTDLILSHFKGRKTHQEFVFNQAAYQKKLQIIKTYMLN